jgi:hypothetical protein
MRIRSLTLATAITLVVAACGSDAGPNSTDGAPDSTQAAPEAVQLSYSLEPGSSMTYEVDMDQSIQMDIEGDPTALAEAGDEDFPATMDIRMTGISTFTHSVADGPEPGTFEITITGDFSDVEFSGTVDGEDITSGDDPAIPDDFSAMEPVETTIIVDEQGNIIPSEEGGMGEEFFGDLGGLGGLDMLGSLGSAAGSPGQFVGPPLTDEEVTVGDTWSETVEVPTLPDSDPIVTTVDSEVVASEDLDGTPVFVIETKTSTSAIDFDFAEMIVGFMTAFLPEDASDEDIAEMEALTEQLRFAFSVDPSDAAMTTWFDAEAGLSRQADVTTDSHVVMDIAMPDETTGELVELAMDMTIDSNLVYRLVDEGGDGA